MILDRICGFSYRRGRQAAQRHTFRGTTTWALPEKAFDKDSGPKPLSPNLRVHWETLMVSGLSDDSSRSRPARVFGIRLRMLISFGLLLSVSVGLVIYVMVFGIPFTKFSGSYGQERSDVFRNLSLVADLKEERLELWMRERRGDAEILTDHGLMEASVQHVRQLALRNLAAGKSPDELRTILLHDEKVAQITQVLKLFQGAYHAYDVIQLAEAGTGVILASSDEKQVGTRIDRALLPSKKPATPDRVSMKVSDDAQTGKTQLIIAKSIFDQTLAGDAETKPIAVGILRIQTDGFIKPMLYTGEGLGKSGEIVSGGSRRPLADLPQVSVARRKEARTA